MKKYSYCSWFSTKTYILSTHCYHLSNLIPVSTNNLCFQGERRRIIILITPLILSHVLYLHMDRKKGSLCHKPLSNPDSMQGSL